MARYHVLCDSASHSTVSIVKANRICPKVSLNIKGKNFEANLIVLELMDIDVILGKGWLSTCKGVIKYAQHSVLLTTPSGERIEYEGIQPTPKEYENDLLEGVYLEDVYHLRASSSRVCILCSVDKLFDHLRGMDAFINMALQFELSSVGSPIFNIPRTNRH